MARSPSRTSKRFSQVAGTTKLHGDCEEIPNLSPAYGRRRRNWIEAHGAVPRGQVVDASCGNKRRITLRHAFLRARVEQPDGSVRVTKIGEWSTMGA